MLGIRLGDVYDDEEVRKFFLDETGDYIPKTIQQKAMK
jgi:hypothetical protein